jgi:hypothetical protein
MNSVEKGLETQLRNIEQRTGKTLEQLYALIRKSGRARHGEIRDLLKEDLGLGHGDANTLAHMYFKSIEPNAGTGAASIDEIVDALYAGPKAALRPIHDRVMTAIARFGDFEIAPKKTYLSLRRRKQFAMVGPATKTRVEVGLNARGLKATARLQALPPGGMCQYKVNLSDASEVDAELISWIRQAYDAAGDPGA